jgi:hypothetical protein
MGMGTAGCHGWIMKWEDISKICPVQAKLLESALEKTNTTLDGFCRDAEFSDFPNDEDGEYVSECWERLRDQFEIATKVGESCLSLDAFYYDSDDGDRYDELEDGGHFCVSGVQVMSEAGKKFQDQITHANWTIYG